MLFHLDSQLLVNIDDGILGILRVFEILEADAIDQLHVALIQHAEHFHVAILLIGMYQFLVG